MPRVVPSQVLRFIGSMQLREANELVSMNSVGPAYLSALLDLVDQVPNELLTMDNDAYASLMYAKAEIKEILATWKANQTAGHQLQRFQCIPSKSPVAKIRDALAKCPDESPAPGTSELTFIADSDLRMNLRNDIGAVHRALTNGEWKAATVLAGSAVEALLLWALKQRSPVEVNSAIANLRASGGLTAKPESDLDRWNLYEFIQVAEKLGVIKANTATQIRLAKDFRNFIHPGVAQRLGEKCDRATAFSANRCDFSSAHQMHILKLPGISFRSTRVPRSQGSQHVRFLR
jgi:hypothetical protein